MLARNCKPSVNYLVIERVECRIVQCLSKRDVFLLGPVDGRFGPWTEWLPCSFSCGGGIQIRMRRCDDPSPRNGGKDCVGSSIDSRECNTLACTGRKALN